MPQPVLALFCRDLRLTDQPMLTGAVQTGRPVVPVFVLTPQMEALGAAPKWRLGLALQAFSRALEAQGSRLILRRGETAAVALDLVRETGAGAVFWSRRYEADQIAEGAVVARALRAQEVEARDFPGFLLHEPSQVLTAEGAPYKVYTPFWNAVSRRAVAPGLPAPAQLAPPQVWPRSDRFDDWHLGAAMQRGAAICAPYQAPGEAAALDRLDRFIAGPVQRYHQGRDFPARGATSGLSEHLTWGEIGPRQIWHAGQRALLEGATGAGQFLKELVWREFAWSLLHHFPRMAAANWRPGWDHFPWRGDNDDAEAWRRGMTGEPFVDAAMRQMYASGTMAGRARMIAASYLTKHLLTDWRIGLDWFADCLTDWDPASNAMGWQWVAGSGPDAAPYFRIFNPEVQAARFDPDAAYRQRWIAEVADPPGAPALSFFEAVPRSWGLDPSRPYPAPRIALAQGRARALAALGQGKA